MKLTAECLIEAIQGETGAVKMYTAYAEQAKKENYPNISRLFLMLAEAEKIHIRNHKSALGDKHEVPTQVETFPLADSLSNVANAIDGESYECKKMYPGFFKKIKKEFPDQYAKVAMLSMEWSSKVEAEHAKRLKDALVQLKKGQDLTFNNFYLCRVCGNIEIGEPTEECPICGHDQLFFMDAEKALKQHQTTEV